MNHILRVFGFGWTYLRRYWPRLSAVIIFSLVFALANGSFIWAMRTITERFTPEPPTVAKLVATAKFSPLSDRMKEVTGWINRTADPWLPRLNQPLDWRQAIGFLLFLPLLVAIRSVADYLSNYCMGWVSERVIRDLRLDIMEK